jgi:hypothetical protein
MKGKYGFLVYTVGILAFLACCVLFSWFLREWTGPLDYEGPTALPSPTSYPRLETEAARAQILGLLETNGGCKFPCWWGITPGKTRWQDAHAILSPLYHDSEPHLGTAGYFSGMYFQGDLPVHEVNISAPETFVESILVLSATVENTSNLSITGIFQSYGIPSEIHIRTFNKLDSHPFSILLYYPTLGVAAGYHSNAYENGLVLRICDLEHMSADFYLAAPNSFTDFSSVANNALWHPQAFRILPLEKATSWTVKSFYMTFREPGANTKCVDTLASLWDYDP